MTYLWRLITYLTIFLLLSTCNPQFRPFFEADTSSSYLLERTFGQIVKDDDRVSISKVTHVRTERGSELMYKFTIGSPLLRADSAAVESIKKNFSNEAFKKKTFHVTRDASLKDVHDRMFAEFKLLEAVNSPASVSMLKVIVKKTTMYESRDQSPLNLKAS